MRGTRCSIFPLPTVGMFGVTARRLEHIVRGAGRFHRRTPKAYYALALLALALLLPGAGLKVVAQAPAGAKVGSNAAAGGDQTDAEKALARLKALGAEVSEQPCEPGERELWIMFGEKWHGTEADLALLGEVAPLAKVGVGFATRSITSQAVSALKLAHPLDSICFYDLSQTVLDELKALPASRTLVLCSGPFTVAGWGHLARLAGSVEQLDIHGGMTTVSNYEQQPGDLVPSGDSVDVMHGINDEGLAALAPMESLKTLRIMSSQMTDAGLKNLAAPKHLERLELMECPKLGRSDFAGIAGLDSLRMLEMDFPVTSAALKNIARLTALESLHCSIGRFAPADVEPLAGLVHLRKLELDVDRPRCGSGLDAGNAGGNRGGRQLRWPRRSPVCRPSKSYRSA